MKNLLKWLLLCVASGLWATPAGAVFTPEPITDPAATAPIWRTFNVYGMDKTGIVKEPDYKGAVPQYGVLSLPGTDRTQGTRSQLSFVIWASKPDGVRDHIVVDANQNGDLTDDPVLENPTNNNPGIVNITTPKAGKVRCQVILMGTQVEFGVAQWLKGKIRLGADEYDAVITDMEMDGVSTQVNGRDYLAVDSARTGKFFPTSGGESMGGWFTPIMPIVSLGGKLWDVTVEPGPDLAFKPYTGPQGKIRYALQWPELQTSATASLMCFAPPDKMFYLRPKGQTDSMALPAGSYSLRGQIMLRSGTGQTILSVQTAEPLVIADGKPVRVTIKKPDKLEVTVKDTGSELLIGKAWKTKGGLDFADILLLNSAGTLSRREPPKIEIYSPSGDKIGSGNMEYG